MPSQQRSLFLSLILVFFCLTWCGAASGGAIADSSNLEAHPLGGLSPVVVRVGLYVTNLSMVNEASEDFELQGYFYTEWYDPRLLEKNVSGPDQAKARSLAPGEVWQPNIDIENVVTFKSFRTDFFCYPNGTVYLEQHFNAVLSAEYYLQRFPFDTQALDFVLQPALSPARPKHQLVAFDTQTSAIGISSDVYLSAWNIKGIQYYQYQASTGLAGKTIPQAEFEVTVKRRSKFYVWQVFFPTVLMAMVPWSVFWVKVNEFDWQMKIPLTIMLAMIAFDFAIARSLPPVNYLTFLDAVLLTSFVFAFVSIIGTLAIHVMILQGRQSLAEWTQQKARWVYPLAYLLAIVVLIPLFFIGAGRPE